MSDTYRLVGYEKGKPVYTRNVRQAVPYRWQHHECAEYRRHWRRRRRFMQQYYLKTRHEAVELGRTYGWITW